MSTRSFFDPREAARDRQPRSNSSTNCPTIVSSSLRVLAFGSEFMLIHKVDAVRPALHIHELHVGSRTGSFHAGALIL